MLDGYQVVDLGNSVKINIGGREYTEDQYTLEVKYGQSLNNAIWPTGMTIKGTVDSNTPTILYKEESTAYHHDGFTVLYNGYQGINNFQARGNASTSDYIQRLMSTNYEEEADKDGYLEGQYVYERDLNDEISPTINATSQPYRNTPLSVDSYIVGPWSNATNVGIGFYWVQNNHIRWAGDGRGNHTTPFGNGYGIWSSEKTVGAMDAANEQGYDVQDDGVGQSTIRLHLMLASNNLYHWKNYFEDLDQNSTRVDDDRININGKYYLYDASYDSISNEGGKDIPGFIKIDHNNNYSNDETKYVFYNRQKFKLSYNNNGTANRGLSVQDMVKTGSTLSGGKEYYEIYYLQQLNEGKYFEKPIYPDARLRDNMEFVGWYLSKDFNQSESLIKLEDKFVMPARDVQLIAKWKPKVYTVKFYRSKADIEAGTGAVASLQVPYQSTVAKELVSNEEISNHLQEIESGDSHKPSGKTGFLGWFTTSSTEEKDIVFNKETPISENIDVFAKWSPGDLLPYTVRYVLREHDNTEKEIAPPSTGYAIEDEEKTFYPLTKDYFYPDFKGMAILPNAIEKKVMMRSRNADESEDPNLVTFYYTPIDEVSYVVHYLVQDGNIWREDSSNVNNVTNTEIVTEKYKTIEGYHPDAYEKTIHLSSDNTRNEIIFYYTRNQLMPVQVTHYLLSGDGETVTSVYQDAVREYQVGTQAPAVPWLSIDGYEKVVSNSLEDMPASGIYDAKSDSLITFTNIDGAPEQIVSGNGLHYKLYYRPKFTKLQLRPLATGDAVDRNESFHYTIKWMEPDGVIGERVVELKLEEILELSLKQYSSIQILEESDDTNLLAKHARFLPTEDFSGNSYAWLLKEEAGLYSFGMSDNRNIELLYERMKTSVPTEETDDSQNGGNNLPIPDDSSIKSKISIYRIYNPNSGEHFYTSSIDEKNILTGLGWRYEGVSWISMSRGSKPIYRLYNANGGEHHYTMDKHEVENLVNLGWKKEGISFYSVEGGNAVYRLYNPNAFSNNHHYTNNLDEVNMLIRLGWRDEGIAWYGYSVEING